MFRYPREPIRLKRFALGDLERALPETTVQESEVQLSRGRS